MNSVPLGITTTPAQIDTGLTADQRYSLQNKSSVKVYLIQKDSAPDKVADFDAVSELYPRGHRLSTATIVLRDGFGIYAWCEGGVANVALNESP